MPRRRLADCALSPAASSPSMPHAVCEAELGAATKWSIW